MDVSGVSSEKLISLGYDGKILEWSVNTSLVSSKIGTLEKSQQKEKVLFSNCKGKRDFYFTS